MTQQPLEGRLALVTGASQGIGEAIARDMAGAGAEVILSARRRDALERIAESIRKDGGRARVATCDMADVAQVRELASRAGPVDILVNNAAATIQEAPPTPLVEMDEEIWHAVLRVNLHHVFVLCRELGRGMVERRRGSIINISSTGGAERVLPLMGPYSVSKAALNVMSRVLAMELAPHGVRCNVVSPGYIDTPATRLAPPATSRAFTRSVPLGRAGVPDEVAAVATFLATDAASYVNGQIVTVDGGLTAGAWGMGLDVN